jgi:hypothetical protein
MSLPLINEGIRVVSAMPERERSTRASQQHRRVSDHDATSAEIDRTGGS